MSRRPRLLVHFAAAALTCGVTSGCAVAWTDKNGTCHAVGLASCTVRRADGVRLAGDIVEMSALGLSLTSNAQTNAKSIGLGYTHTTSAAFADNAVALGPFNHIDDPNTASKRSQP